MSRLPSVESYFRRSPFRSLGFDVVTGVVVVLAWSDLRAMHLQTSTLRASAAIFGLTLLPVVVWFFSLLLHFEIRALLEETGEMSVFSRIAALHYSRVARLLWAIPLGVAIMSSGIIQALITSASIRQ
jgi:hypothetical protein